LEGALDMGHARALLALDPARQIEAAHRIAAKGLSVREAESLVQSSVRGKSAQRGAVKRDRDLERLEEELSASLGTTVEIHAAKKGRGKLLVHYSSLDHLDQLLKKLR
jgi:ParB family chromosome partitioning protein